MGNSLPRRATGGAATCRVILADCTVVAMEEGATVAELMLEHPQQFVVELRSFLAGNRAAPLPADQQLEVGKVYLMLPMKSGKAPVSSAGEARRILSKKRSGRRSHGTPAGAPPEEEKKAAAGPPELPFSELGDSPALTGRQHHSARFTRAWRPSLHTIEERAAGRKLPHWLF
ncbi:unnamed protein product [Spirodela intermedia]|uniref:Uncharacterized protein n=1 Tax=Spirodela intermedia TaxID=51605 RepID=A0A7I8KKR1_SPIIN|nr:unnamed protein product [Spirodela intermedia]